MHFKIFFYVYNSTYRVWGGAGDKEAKNILRNMLHGRIIVAVLFLFFLHFIFLQGGCSDLPALFLRWKDRR